MQLASGPFIIDHLKGRVESLTNALERAQERIDELEKAFGSDEDIIALLKLGLTPSEAKAVHLIHTREHVTAKQVLFAIYAEDPDQMNEVNAYANMKVFISNARRKLKRFGLSIATLGWGEGYSGYYMPGPDKSRLAKLMATGARSGVSMRQFKQAAE